MSGGPRMSLADFAQTRAGADPRNRRLVAEAAGLPANPRINGNAEPRINGSTPALACLEFTVPTDPRGWQKPKPLGYGLAIKGREEQAYQGDIAKFARQAKEAAGLHDLIRGGVRLSVIAYLVVPPSYRPSRRADCLAGRILPAVKPDFDRILNSVGDALTGVLWVDDKQVVAGSCLKVWAEVGSLYVRVQAL